MLLNDYMKPSMNYIHEDMSGTCQYKKGLPTHFLYFFLNTA